ncbi:MAG TPA: type II secretion system protein [Dehalococcoidales bacterium]
MVKKFVSDEHGFTLLEVIVAIALLGILAVGLLSAVATSNRALITADERETAKNLAESQIEYTKGLTFAPAYSPAEIPAEYAGYSVSINVEPILSRDVDIQEVTVTIHHRGREILSLSGYKVR